MKLISLFVLLILSVHSAEVCYNNDAVPTCGSAPDCRTTTNCNSTCVSGRCVLGTLSCPSACDTDTGRCKQVQCTSDVDCANNITTSTCNTNTGTCVPCLRGGSLPCYRPERCSTNGCVNPSGGGGNGWTVGVCSSPVENCTATVSIFSTCVPGSGCSGECFSDSQCAVLYPNTPSKKVCRLGNSQNSGGTCVECTGSSHCVTSQTYCGTCNQTNQCSSYSNCTGRAPYCYRGVCGDCTTDSSCQTQLGNPDATCNLPPGGTVAVCEECQSNDDCHFQDACDAVCNMTTKRCSKTNSTQNCLAQGKTCQSIANNVWGCYECSDNDQCVDPTKSVCSQGTCVQCDGTSNTQCDYTCGTCVNKTCVAGNCSAPPPRSGCVCLDPAYPVCNNSNVCVECIDATSCKVKLNDCGASCNANGRCVASTLNCSNSNQVCNFNTGQCQECTSNSHCTNASKPYCSSENTCVECTQASQCYRNADCAKTCTSGRCTVGSQALNGGQTSCNCSSNSNATICLSTGACGVCNDDSQCTVPPYLKCVTSTSFGFLSRVVYASACAQCSQDSDCQSTTNCNAECPAGVCVNTEVPLNCSSLGPFASCNNGRCRECTRNSDCPSSKPTCNNNNKCVCTRNTDCRSNSACDSVCGGDGVCRPGSLSCPNGQVCNEDSGSCIECTGDNDCSGVAGKPYCSNSVCVACKNNNHEQCRSPSKCNALCISNTCVDQGLNCGTQVCLTSIGKCVECTSNAQCGPTKPWCVTTSSGAGVCMECRPNDGSPINNDCRTSSDCNATCVSFPEGTKCVPGGLNCATKPALTKCLASQATCVNCLQNSDCPSNNCLNYRCAECSPSNATQCSTNSNCGGSCTSEGTCSTGVNCGAGKFCRSIPISRFQSSWACVECLTANDCPGGGSCSSTGKCGACTTSTDCIKDSACTGAVCVDQVCDFSAAQACPSTTPKCRRVSSTSSQCVQCLDSSQCSGSTPYCSGQNRCVACTSNSHCQTASSCDATCSSTGICVNSASPLVCSGGKTCSNGNCVGGGGASNPPPGSSSSGLLSSVLYGLVFLSVLALLA